ncbi:hypothetical protein I0C86_30810 [Plantactinospora sp. S1510]|uniref:Integral membrane protein n=1 Tax=Plantactinospora alkalitolerans TaxID=2789879 RepID=A0ABS0H4E4_9ACTN|nr:hypothetical protein [Plantactinospora alkalitolerans]MBF9133322.1 hypothetical protein [Plantactinospora alkalitolerans]
MPVVPTKPYIPGGRPSEPVGFVSVNGHDQSTRSPARPERTLHGFEATEPTAWRPFELTLLAAAATSGIVVVTFPASVPSAVDPLAIEWSLCAVGLVLVAIVGSTLLGCRTNHAVALALRLGSLILLGTASAMYAVALLASFGMVAAPAGVFIAAIAVASWWSAGRITRSVVRPGLSGRRPDDGAGNRGSA